MIEELRNTRPEFLNPFQKWLLEQAALGKIVELPPQEQTIEEAREEMQKADAARRERNMKAGQSRLDGETTPVGPGSVLLFSNFRARR
ncbi:MAG: hypothetical protein QG639_636 [Patescibacteria group bacterium]|nr:hypothetical protein [Patescibacteria group bacterium]